MRATAAFVTMTALMLGAAACADEGTPTPSGSSSAGPAAMKEGLKITFLPKQLNNPYFDTSDNKGGKVAVEELKGVYA
jgi:rhamnose transport system substrate-binding protein